MMRRAWTYTKDEWEWPHPWSFVYFGGDEFWRRTVVLRLPFRNVVVALWKVAPPPEWNVADD